MTVSRIFSSTNTSDRISLAIVAIALGFVLLPARIKMPLLLPLQTVILAPLRGSNEIIRTLTSLRHQNQQLADLAIRLAIENARLRSLTNDTSPSSKPSTLPLVRATVIARDLTTFRSYLVISAGTIAGVHQGCPVITANGVVGKTIACSPHQSLVQTLLATDCRVAVVNLRSRVPALTRVDADGMLALDYVSKDADYRVGDTVVTAGLGGIFPRGIVVGFVTSIPASSTGLFQQIKLRPAAELTTLTEVFVIIIPDTLVTGWLANLVPLEVAIPEGLD